MPKSRSKHMSINVAPSILFLAIRPTSNSRLTPPILLIFGRTTQQMQKLQTSALQKKQYPNKNEGAICLRRRGRALLQEQIQGLLHQLPRQVAPISSHHFDTLGVHLSRLISAGPRAASILWCSPIQKIAQNGRPEDGRRPRALVLTKLIE